jgi:molybdenum cofactor biosynthesis enzyme MoaA
MNVCRPEGASAKCYVLPVKSACNAHCKFCATISYGSHLKKELMLPNSGFDVIARKLGRAGVKRYEITGGGEPTLNPHLATIVSKLRSEADASYIKLYTNGQRVPKVSSVDEVNISRVHWSDQINERFMKFRQPIKPIREIAAAYKSMGVFTVRLSVPLIEGAIDSVEKAMELIDITSPYIDRYVFRPLYDNTPDKDLQRIDFDIHHARAEVDRDACGDMRGNPIWAPDHRLYVNWTLDRPFEAFDMRE